MLKGAKQTRTPAPQQRHHGGARRASSDDETARRLAQDRPCRERQFQHAAIDALRAKPGFKIHSAKRYWVQGKSLRTCTRPLNRRNVRTAAFRLLRRTLCMRALKRPKGRGPKKRFMLPRFPAVRTALELIAGCAVLPPRRMSKDRPRGSAALPGSWQASTTSQALLRYASASSVIGCATRNAIPRRLAPLMIWSKQPGLPVATTSAPVLRM